MTLVDFEIMKRKFKDADVDQKITMYSEARDLSTEQYKELLKLFPLSELKRLETALNY